MFSHLVAIVFSVLWRAALGLSFLHVSCLTVFRSPCFDVLCFTGLGQMGLMFYGLPFLGRHFDLPMPCRFGAINLLVHVF